MPVFSVVQELCHQDGICASVCPAHVIKGPKGATPFMRPGGEASCIACGQCMAFCPHGAARVDALPLDDLQRLDRDLLPGPEALGMLIRSRRSIRHFKKEPVPKALLAEVLAQTRYAPSAKNRRPVRWVLAYTAKSMREVGDLVAAWLESCVNNPTEGPFIPESKALLRAWRSGLDPLFRGAPHLALAVAPKDWKWAASDAAIALTYLELAALPHNIGACWAGYVSTAAQLYKPLATYLGLDEHEQVQGGQMLGFIGLRPSFSAPRKALPANWL